MAVPLVCCCWMGNHGCRSIPHRDVGQIALSVCLAFITEPLAGIADTAVIEPLNDAGAVFY